MSGDGVDRLDVQQDGISHGQKEMINNLLSPSAICSMSIPISQDQDQYQYRLNINLRSKYISKPPNMTVTQYDQIGDDYNNIVVLPTSILQHTAIRTHIGDVHDLDVLDIACGTGVHSHHFAKAGARKVLGLDLSDAMVESARRQAVDNGVSEFRVADGSKPLRVGQFDLVLAAWLLNYACNVDELQIMWQNLFDSLKPGGRCVGIVPDMNQAQSPDGENPFGQSSKLLDTVPGGVRVRTTLYANTPMSFNHYVRELAVLEECARQAGFLGVQWMPPVDPHISGVDFASFVKAPVFQVFSVTRPSCEI